MPEDYFLILFVARRLARKEIETQIRDAGPRVFLTPTRVITEKANELLKKRPDLFREAARIVAAHPEWRPKKRSRK